MPDIPNLPAATDAVIASLEEGGFDYAFIGGLAVILRGHDRFTQDVDALVWGLDGRLNELAALLVKHGFRSPSPNELHEAPATRVLRTAWHGQVIVDFMLGLVPFEREALDHATTVPLEGGVAARVAIPEDLVIMKLIASRDKDISDIIALTELYPDMDRKRIRTIVTGYAEALERPEIVENLEKWFP